ncbi:tyrosine-protein phosphatase [Paracoccus sp. R12_1]|uniref:tyrosine-protein phosphatase n=1 Tax=unclassified Paracoccus (in: a-proteobacteria) TaxID=2688777 RepID=UPI001ADBE04D|nr:MULTISPECIES: tyrosine-protein phosphatase [unclassified Paracoccus (in: a-proteobacteria)]MBO9453696.1 tyrosine-protein phosphatase [Paracoccus sp. R12_2]MBO9486880.1 tyrosine-protein phosphatase [Paracoccus sp. R12_1]
MWRWIRRCLAGVGVVMAAAIIYLAYLQLSGNFHAVVAGEVYRAAQMDGQRLARWKREHGIATVLNLRGENTGADWYEAERGVAERLGIGHIDFRMSAARSLDRAQVQDLLQVMRDAPKPLLIHCMGGADRTGLASALYVAGIAGGGEEAAEWQLSPIFGHIGIPGLSRAYPMDVTWEDMEPWLGFPDS